MISQTLFILIRRFRSDPAFSLVTLLGLALGLAAFILMSQFISSFMTWDKHNEHFNRIYRVQLHQAQEDNVVTHSASLTAALSRHELTGLPEIEKTILMHDVGDNNKNGVFLSPDRNDQFLTRWGYYTDPEVFDVFTFTFIEGHASQSLQQPYSIVLSKSVAERLFKGEKAVGKQVYLENRVILTVTGVYQDLPYKSTWKPSFILPMQLFTPITGWKNYEDNYWAYSFFTYVLLKENALPDNVDQKIHDALQDYNKDHFPYLRPLSQLYINAYFQPDLFIAIGLLLFNTLLILILSCINYVNLQTANASTRFREIGVKKTVGFSKKQLWYQFMAESVILSLTCGILALFFTQLVRPYINKILGNNILESIFTDWRLMGIVMLVSLLTGIVSGIHPAFAISSFNPVTALKQKLNENNSNGISLRKVLVTAQFSIAIFLLSVGFIIYKQSNYMVTHPMGFETKNLIFSNIVTEKKGSNASLREQLLRNPEIAEVCHADYIPFILPGGGEVNWEGADPDQEVFVRYSQVSHDFVPTFDLSIVKGRNFSRDFPSDYNKCLLNETAIKVFGWKDPLGRKIKIRQKEFEVIGIIKDYVVFSVHNPLEPHFYRLVPDTIKSDMVYAVRYKPGFEVQAKTIVKNEFEQFFPDDAFEFQHIETLIKSENAVKEWRKLMKINMMFAVMSIIVSSIGLFGLILFYTRYKLKEVGIRKVLGFTSIRLYYTLSSGFIKLLPFSIIFAWPLAYYAYVSLPGANKYPFQIWELVYATLIVLGVAVITISYQILKAMKVKPVEIIKDE
jgi:putative ABC transport system permease protein